MTMTAPTFEYAKPEASRETLVDVLDQILDVGIVAKGDLTISVADIDLIYLGLKLLICTPDKLDEFGRPQLVGESS